MEKVSVDEVESGRYRSVDRYALTEELDTSDVSINSYRVEPGGRLAGLHAHVDQEEVFIVTEGEATFETFDAEKSVGDEVSVSEDELVRFAPGEYQSCKNDSEKETRIYALGAPRETEDFRVPVECSDCAHGNTRPDFSGDSEVLVCPECGAESAVECPECGSSEMRAVLDDDSVVSVCLECGSESEPKT